MIPATRQRKSFDPDSILKLAGSITDIGLIHPPVVRTDSEGTVILVAGERRIKAMQYIWNFGDSVECGDYQFEEGIVPCILYSEMDPLDAMEMELEENIRRQDLTWQERATATANLYNLRRAQAERDGKEEPTPMDLAREVHGESDNNLDRTRREILVAKHLDDPDVAKAKTADEGFKVLKRKEEVRRNEALAQSVGATLTMSSHRLELGDCFEVMEAMDNESFDIILTDPPYGIDADTFGDSGGMAAGNHFYDDSWTTWNKLAKRLSVESFRLAKSQCHAYVFCDIDNFVMFKSFMIEAGWKVFRTPLIWVNPGGSRAPWPEQGPQRKYQIILYAVKGDKPVTRIYPDIITAGSDDNLGHHAQKPVEVYCDLLRRSCRPGDSVLDPFMGSGTIIPACHEMKCYATGIEVNPAAFGIATTRLKGLT